VELKLPEGLAALIILNIHSYMGGTEPWPANPTSKKWKPRSMSDGLLEIVGVMGVFHLGRIQARLSKGVKIAQAASIKVTLLTAGRSPDCSARNRCALRSE
jgi:diacylglycerol kinase (ATP)